MVGVFSDTPSGTVDLLDFLFMVHWPISAIVGGLWDLDVNWGDLLFL